MIIRPVYNLLLLPDVSYYFKRDFFTDFGADELENGSDILFIFLKEEKESGEYDAEDFYPIGLSARVDGMGEEDSVAVRTLERVNVSELSNENGRLTASVTLRPEADDLTPHFSSAFCPGLSVGTLGAQFYPAAQKCP